MALNSMKYIKRHKIILDTETKHLQTVYTLKRKERGILLSQSKICLLLGIHYKNFYEYVYVQFKSVIFLILQTILDIGLTSKIWYLIRYKYPNMKQFYSSC